MRVAQRERGANPLVGSRRRHADVGDHDVGELPVDERDELVVRSAGADDFEPVLVLEQLDDALAYEEVVLGDHDAQCHRQNVTGDPRARRVPGTLVPAPLPHPCPVRSNNAMSVDAIVVGAGQNGLTAAARIARAGYSVVVYERGPTIGGSTRTMSLMKPDVVHDVGATVVPFAAASPAFAALGLDLPFVFSGLALAHPLDGGRAAIVDRSLDVTADALGADGPRYRRLIGPLVKHFDAFADATLAPVIRQALHPVLAARFGPLLILPGATLAQIFSTEEARALLIGLASHATVPVSRPLTAGVGLTLLAAAHAVGWPMIEGGTQVVTERLAAVVRAEGGEIVVDHEVRSLADLPQRA